VGDVIILENELLTNTSIGTILVQLVRMEEDFTSDMAVKQRQDHQSNKYPDLCIVGPWSDSVANLDYNQDSPSWCGSLPSGVAISDEVLNPNVPHNLEILRQHVWKGNDSGSMGPRVYTDEEEREAAIRYLKNRSAATEEPFTEVAKKKKLKDFQVHNIDPRVSYLIDSWSFLSYFSFLAPLFSLLFVLLLISCYFMRLTFFVCLFFIV